MRILAIETSCDETAIAIAEFSGGKAKPAVGVLSRPPYGRQRHLYVLSHILASQAKVHAEFGGVVPNLARREHQKNLVPILLEALKEAEPMRNAKVRNQNPLQAKSYELRQSQGLALSDGATRRRLEAVLECEPELLTQFKKYILPLPAPQVDAIAVTHGPGLEPALWVGVNFARALSILWNKPLMPVNHMAGHIYSALLEATQSNAKRKTQKLKNRRFYSGSPEPEASGRWAKLQLKNQNFLKAKSYRLTAIKFPAIALLVSGGHTQLVLTKGHGKYQMLGETRDDAAGEAFDKVARLLGLGGIQGGPAISALAESGIRNQESGIRVKFPRPMLHTKDYDFSFSGLKTAVLYKLRELEKEYPMKELQPVIAKEFQDAAVEVLVKKTLRAAEEYKVKTVLLGGGVSANSLLRETLGKAIGQTLPNTKYLIPDPSMTGDNALMIALAAFFAGKKAKAEGVRAEASLRLS